MIRRFPDKKNAGCPKAPRDFPSKKDGILCLPCWVSFGTPLTLPHSLHRRTYAYVTTKFSRIDRLPNLQAMVLCWRATRAGSARKTSLNSFLAPFSRIFSSLLCFVHILKYPDSPYNRRLGAPFRMIAACYEMAVPVKV